MNITKRAIRVSEVKGRVVLVYYLHVAMANHVYVVGRPAGSRGGTMESSKTKVQGPYPGATQ